MEKDIVNVVITLTVRVNPNQSVDIEKELKSILINKSKNVEDEEIYPLGFISDIEVLSTKKIGRSLWSNYNVESKENDEIIELKRLLNRAVRNLEKSIDK